MNTENVAMGYIFYEDKCLLVKHKKTGKYMSCGGHIEENELIQEALIREIKEELNLDINLHQVKNDFNSLENELTVPFVINCKKISNSKRIQIFEYICFTKNLSNLKVKLDEIENYKLFNYDEIKNSNEITNSTKEIILRAFQILNL